MTLMINEGRDCSTHFNVASTKMSDELTVITDIWADGGTDNLIYNGRFEL